MIFESILISTIAISLISLIGILLLIGKINLDNILIILVGLSAGGLMGGALLHLMPESIEMLGIINPFYYLLIGFILFFVMEKILWRHCHKNKCDIHPFTYLNLIGDGIHNFIDGLIIAASFISGNALGFATVIAVALHEIPQELGDFGVLIYGGFGKKKALLFNFVTALTAVLGGLIGFFIYSFVGNYIFALLPFAAGGFLYIAASDLIPELHKEKDSKKSILSFISFLVGLLIMLVVKLMAA